MLVCGTLNHLHKNHLFQLYAELSLKLKKRYICCSTSSLPQAIDSNSIPEKLSNSHFFPNPS